MELSGVNLTHVDDVKIVFTSSSISSRRFFFFFMRQTSYSPKSNLSNHESLRKMYKSIDRIARRTSKL